MTAPATGNSPPPTDTQRAQDDARRFAARHEAGLRSLGHPNALARQFDLQQKRRDLELARVEAQLKKLRAMMKKRADEWKTIIDKRVGGPIKFPESKRYESTERIEPRFSSYDDDEPIVPELPMIGTYEDDHGPPIQLPP